MNENSTSQVCMQSVRLKNSIADIRTLKQALNNRLILKKVHKVIIFNQKEWHIILN